MARNILVVEDDRNISELIRMYLEKEGYATKTYGGAILGNSTKTDLSYTIRNKTNVEAKNQIAELVSEATDGRIQNAAW